MFKRQSLLVAGCGRSLCRPTVRVSGVRSRSEMQRGGDGGANSTSPYSSSSTPSYPSPSPETPSSPAISPSTSSSSPDATHQSNVGNGRTRQQRATQVSEEVALLNDGGPGVLHPHIQSKTIDASEVIGQTYDGQMGQNESPGREGVNTQGLGQMISPDNETRNDKSSSSLEDDIEEDDDDMAPSTEHELVLLEQFDKQDITAVPFEPESVTRDDFLKLGQGGATIAAGNYEGVIEDRLRLLGEPTQDSFRWAPTIAARMMKGGFVSFNDEAERTAVMAAAEKYAQHRADAYSVQKAGEEVEKPEHEFAPVPQKSQSAMFDKLVRGSYTHPSVAPHKQPLLNDIVRNTMRNSSYLERDQSKLLQKIRSLMPSDAAAARKPAPKSRK